MLKSKETVANTERKQRMGRAHSVTPTGEKEHESGGADTGF